MDTEKMIDELLENKDIQDIPIDYVFRVAYVILNIIASGDCYRSLE